MMRALAGCTDDGVEKCLDSSEIGSFGAHVASIVDPVTTDNREADAARGLVFSGQ
jgi:hypothetical protein